MALFTRRPKKVAVITRRPYYRGGRKAGFHCIPWFPKFLYLFYTIFSLFLARLVYFWGNDIPLTNSTADPRLPLGV